MPNKPDKIPVIYIIGPFRAPTPWGVECNVRRAEELGLLVAQLNAMPLIPHANTRFFQGLKSDSFWLEGTLELLRRCDACACVEGWENSQGSKTEVKFATANSIPVFFKTEINKSFMDSLDLNNHFISPLDSLSGWINSYKLNPFNT
jgi:hypothetical protein